MVRAWLAKKLISRSMDALNRGDVGPILRMETGDVHFRFPGSSSWAVDIVGKEHVAAWLKRMVATGLQHHPEEVVASGPPWRMTLVLRGTDRFDEPDGTPVYDNRYVLWARTRWGRIYDYEAYEDTERSLAFDAYLSLRTG
jgi:ketosteroid isomerase-like protein